MVVNICIGYGQGSLSIHLREEISRDAQDNEVISTICMDFMKLLLLIWGLFVWQKKNIQFLNYLLLILIKKCFVNLYTLLFNDLLIILSMKLPLMKDFVITSWVICLIFKKLESLDLQMKIQNEGSLFSNLSICSIQSR